MIFLFIPNIYFSSKLVAVTDKEGKEEIRPSKTEVESSIFNVRSSDPHDRDVNVFERDKSLLSDSEAESNALGYVNYEDSDAYMSIDEMVPTINVSGHECVDLGLPSGILWSKCDIGASSPEIVGDKYAWGELEVHECNSTLCNHYKFFKEGSSANITKYNFKSSRGHVDNKKELDPCDDVAYVRYGKRWRIPSCKEWNELRQLCIWKPGTYKGVEGFWVFGLNDNFIFVNNRYHWTRDLDDNDCVEAKRTYHVKDAFDLSLDTHYRPAAYPIRPICYPQ